VTRKRQFDRLVSGFGGRFVWGLQPVFFSKADLSPSEQAGVIPYERGDVDRISEVLKALPQAYEAFSRHARHDDVVAWVNFHEEFAHIGSEATLFDDTNHLRPAGEEIIAQRYLREIVERFGEELAL
jgi:hypothetical protein